MSLDWRRLNRSFHINDSPSLFYTKIRLNEDERAKTQRVNTSEKIESLDLSIC